MVLTIDLKYELQDYECVLHVKTTDFFSTQYGTHIWIIIRIVE